MHASLAMKWHRPIFDACLHVATDVRVSAEARARSASMATSLARDGDEISKLEAAFARSIDDSRTVRVLARALLRANSDGARRLVIEATAEAFAHQADDLTSVLVVELLLSPRAADEVREECATRASLHWRRSRKHAPLGRLIEAWSRSRDLHAAFVADTVREVPRVLERLASSTSLLVRVVAAAPTADAWRALARVEDAVEVDMDMHAFGDLDEAIAGLRVALDREPRTAARAALRHWLAELGEDA